MGFQQMGASSHYKGQYLPLVMAVVGATDIVLGILMFTFGPGVVDEPSLDVFIKATGVVFIAGGALFLWFAQWRKTARGAASNRPG